MLSSVRLFVTLLYPDIVHFCWLPIARLHENLAQHSASSSTAFTSDHTISVPHHSLTYCHIHDTYKHGHRYLYDGSSREAICWRQQLILADRPVRGTVTNQRLKILRCSTTQFQKSFVPRTITRWNTLPDNITSAAFRSQLNLSHVCGRAHLVTLISLSGDWRLLSRSRYRTKRE